MRQLPDQTPPPAPAALALVRPSPAVLAEEADRREEASVARYLTSRRFAEIAETARLRAEAIARLEHSLRRVGPEAA
jgi:hypothetical protein